MITRIALAAVVAAFAATAVVAQGRSDRRPQGHDEGERPVSWSGRRNFMKGEEPFDLAKAQAIFASYQKAAADFGKLFPDNSKSGDTAALPGDLGKQGRFRCQDGEVRRRRQGRRGQGQGRSDLKAVFPEVQKNCGGCHDTYRKKAS